MTNYIYSTLGADVRYHLYAEKVNKEQASANRVRASVLINGGAGVMNKNFITPHGVVTEISDDDLEKLSHNTVFKAHCDRGFITVQKRKTEVEKVVKDMTKKDGSAQTTPEDLGKKFKKSKSSGGSETVYESQEVLQ